MVRKVVAVLVVLAGLIVSQLIVGMNNISGTLSTMLFVVGTVFLWTAIVLAAVLRRPSHGARSSRREQFGPRGAIGLLRSTVSWGIPELSVLALAVSALTFAVFFTLAGA